ncbi:MAG: sigma 54-interacting transcriptional regulator [Clostridiales Family XIII bacterium]|jgi:transcriptional regulator with PAS, ATPase and Fis domain|nr:sigma 54-interacting transcriptional regulator [Clostridiales Family XIII bacterium]
MPVNPFYNIENPELIGYEYAWVDYFRNGVCNDGIVGRRVCESWGRCDEAGLSATAGKTDAVLCPPVDFESRIERNTDYLKIADTIVDSVIDTLEGQGIGVYIVDADGIVLRLRCERGTELYLGEVRSDLCERAAGTNCVDFALRYLEAVSVIGAQHYFQHYHKYAGYAAPIRDVGGETLGAIAIFVRLEHMSGYMMPVAATAAKAIENGIDVLRSHAVIERQNSEKQDILDSVTDGIIYIDKNRRISYVNQKFLDFYAGGVGDLRGKKVNNIRMRPRIDALLDEANKHVNLPVKLIGEKKSWRALLNHHPAHSNLEGENEILIFTTTDEVEEMAGAISKEGEPLRTFESIIGSSMELRKCVANAKRAADYGARVILEGESGTGKEVFAQAIHNRSSRCDEAFVAVDCGAIPRELLESEIFGYEDGAFTGALKGGRAGRFEQAHKGTLFLDEIGNLPYDMQAKLLRVLNDSLVTRIGGQKATKVDVHIIAATNRDLRKEIEAGHFREDLYYRLNVVHINIPPLRERREDIPLLVENFIRQNRQRTGIRTVDEDAMRALRGYSWPGNVRQLYNIFERMMIFADGTRITVDMLPKIVFENAEGFARGDMGESSIDDLDTVSARYVNNVYGRFGGNIKRTAEALKISRSTVYRMLRGAGYLPEGGRDNLVKEGLNASRENI